MFQGKNVAVDSYITVSEASKFYNREVSVIRRACLYGWVPAMKIGNQWIIRKADAEARWGNK